MNQKISVINNSLKYNPRIFVVNDLRFYESNFESGNSLIIYFKDLKTIFSEQLPNFSKPPFINVQGHSIDIDVRKVTNEYVEFNASSTTFEKYS